MKTEKKFFRRSPVKLPGFSQNHGSSWKVAYADFVTAMMAFFLLMWVTTMAPPSTLKKIEGYFQGDSKQTKKDSIFQTSGKEIVQSKISEESKPVRYAILLRFKKIISEDPYYKTSAGVSDDDVGILLRIQSGIFFLPGSVTLTSEARKIISDVVDILKTYNVSLVVRGYADKSELNNGMFPSCWELSGARASAAVRAIVAAGIQTNRIRSVAYGDSLPLLPEYLSDSGNANRRVEFYFYRQDVYSSKLLQ